MRVRNLLIGSAIAAAAVASPAIARSDVSFSLNIGPPAPIVETVPPPRVGYAWAPGYWNWNGHKHVWVKGRYIHERHGQHWVADHWASHDGRWSLEHGHWSG